MASSVSTTSGRSVRRRSRAVSVRRRRARRAPPARPAFGLGRGALLVVLGAIAGGALAWRLAPRGDAPPAYTLLPPGAIPDPLRTPAGAYRWTDPPPPLFPIPPYARHLDGVLIVLDPGHGGRAWDPTYKAGPTGLREAVVNLAVAQRLAEFLRAAGAKVVLTREADVALADDDKQDLKARIDVANRLRADLFLSIHHNAAASPDVNYTSVYYHGQPDDQPASVAAARQIADGLNDALRLEQFLGSTVVSDYSIYPKDGFAVLRQAQVPAVLSEASFHSHPIEESRLRDAVYNRREAYGLFLGLARWAAAGLPRVELAGGGAARGRALTITLDDGLSGRGGLGAGLPKILEATLRVEAGGAPAAYRYDARARTIQVTPPPGADRLYVNFSNINGQWVLHPWLEVK